MASMATTRILVVAIGSYGDVLPLVALALALQQRGYEIRFFSNGYFSELVQQAGLTLCHWGQRKSTKILRITRTYGILTKDGNSSGHD